MSIDQILEKIEERKKFEEKYNVPPSLHFESECAHRLEGLLDILQYCFEKWAMEVQRAFNSPNYIAIEKNDSYFINFNYTNVLEWLYKIPEERILHIHGSAAKHDHLVFGHNRMMLSRTAVGIDEEKVGDVLDKYHKNPFKYIFEHDELPEILKDVEHVYILGLSFSPVDLDYIDWIYKSTPLAKDWRISWFSEEDKNRIEKFIYGHYKLAEKVELVRLEELKV